MKNRKMNMVSRAGSMLVTASAICCFTAEKSEGAVTITLSETLTGISARVQGSFNTANHTFVISTNFNDTQGLGVNSSTLIYDSGFSNVLSLYSYSGSTPVVTGDLQFSTGRTGDSLGYFRVDNGGGLFLSSQFLGGATVDFTNEFTGSFASLGITAGQFRTFTFQSDFATIVAVPEPSSCLLLGLGSLSLFYYRRRR